MLKEIEIKFTITIDDEAEINRDDYFFYWQGDKVTPSIRRSRDNEDWNGFLSSITGETSRWKIVSYKGIVIHK